MVHRIKEGLDLPIQGKPVQNVEPGPEISTVALLGDDYIGMRPTMLVDVGDRVKLGQPIFGDKKTEGVIFTSPGSGTVKAINRGEKRKFLSMEIELSGNDEVTFASHNNLDEIDRQTIEDQLVESGLWTAIRTRPFSRTPVLGTEPNSIFVTATDTNPLAAEPELVISQHADDFASGLRVVRQLTEGKTYVCTRDDSRVPGEGIPNVVMESFAGPHPAGLAGTHIHLLDPVGPNKTVWQIGYQDVIAIGHLFTSGKLMTERTVAVGGPLVGKPSLFKTRLGACLDDVIKAADVDLKNARVISGSILCGRASGESVNYLGRFDNQISVLEEGNKREFLGWQKPGFDKFSLTKIYGGSFLKDTLFKLTTSTGGSHRAMVPVGTYERVMPLDILPTQLLRALLSGETDDAQALGVLELSEEDLGLCTFVCPGKNNYGSILRENLTVIEKEG